MNDSVAKQMRLGMRRLAAGICVVTTADSMKARLAMTASSVTSVSDNPASLLVCVHKSSYLVEAIQATKNFSVNVLSQEQQEISVLCSSQDSSLDRFALGAWVENVSTGVNYLKNALSVFHCHCSVMHEYGTHYIIIGDVQSVFIEGENITPLVYLDGQYVKLAN